MKTRANIGRVALSKFPSPKTSITVFLPAAVKYSQKGKDCNVVALNLLYLASTDRSAGLVCRAHNQQIDSLSGRNHK